MASAFGNVMNYLDDFLIFGAPDSDECEQALKLAMQVCKLLGVPIAVHKTEGPLLVIVFLGIELDTRAGVIRLPGVKLRRLQEEIRNGAIVNLVRRENSVAYRSITACVLCRQTGQIFPASHDLPIDGGQRTSPQDSPE